MPMRALLAIAAFAALVATSSGHASERRIFIIANTADGYGVDRCLASGANCGVAAATAYCKSREFAQAVSFSKVDKDEITGAVPTAPTACRGGGCDEYVAIVCTR